MIETWQPPLSVGPLASQPEPPADGIVGFVTDLVDRLGGPGAGLAVALENLFPPIPSEVILPLAGFAASQGKINLVAAIAWTTLGSVVGAVALYYVGVALGRDRVRAIAARLPLVKISDIDRTEAWFVRHGAKTVFFGRMIPIFRSLISIPAGLERMPMAKFLLFTTLGSLVWNSLFVMAGYQLGENWHTVESYVGTFQNLVIAVCALAVGYFAVSRLLRLRRNRQSPPGGRGGLGTGPDSESAQHARMVGPPAVVGRQPGTDGPTRAERGTLYGTSRRSGR